MPNTQFEWGVYFLTCYIFLIDFSCSSRLLSQEIAFARLSMPAPFPYIQENWNI